MRRKNTGVLSDSPTAVAGMEIEGMVSRQIVLLITQCLQRCQGDRQPGPAERAPGEQHMSTEGEAVIRGQRGESGHVLESDK